ncbi:MAG: succinate dehydrogenase/fumarate reductase iron-sulfur subunit, partial [Candidatus Tectomicrobia bacterium]|nr:succinate dehydrogenase/fumarate reductase iron-sulfur subunit [Candidatus Tectomicrobia bacterium]
MDFTLFVWRQNGPDGDGEMVRYRATNIAPDASFLEMLDLVNNGLEAQGE